MQVAALQLQSCSSREKPFKLLKSPASILEKNDCSDSSESKQVKQVSEAGKIKKLSERLKILEEETGPLKQEIFQHMEERKKVVAEIYQQFQTIHHRLQFENHHRLQFENQVREEGSPHDGSSSIVKFLKKAGLGMAGQKSYTDRQVHALLGKGFAVGSEIAAGSVRA
ncbi:hypothetical protein OIU74_015311 [Salix koriyanagi]|uniref:Uncharacterized protein n=1 Tax=Salix koriyanagi TaxID=2511006 RepID=A0A9Q0T0Z0_9ROSI|nr:hypothetical protein OIU74_015311 [Salix koriyanagi]